MLNKLIILNKMSMNNSWLNITKGLFVNILIFSIVTTFSLLLSAYQNTQINAYRYDSFDYILHGPSKEQVFEISEEVFVDEVTPVSINEISLSSRSGSVVSEAYMFEEWDDLENTYFSHKNIIKSDAEEHENGIYVDKSISDYLGLDIGDTITFHLEREGVVLSHGELKVSGIFQYMPNVNRSSAVIKLNEDIKKKLEKSVLYSYAFVNLNDEEAFLKYVENEYIPMGFMPPRDSFDTDDEYLSFVDEFSEEFKGNGNEMIASRKLILERSKEGVEFSPPTVVVTSLMSMLLLVIILIVEQSHVLRENMRNYSLLYAHGMKKSQIAFLLTIVELIRKLPIVVVALVITRYISFGIVLKKLFLPSDMFFKASMSVISIFFCSVVIASFVLAMKLRQKQMHELLLEE